MPKRNQPKQNASTAPTKAKCPNGTNQSKMPQQQLERCALTGNSSARDSGRRPWPTRAELCTSSCYCLAAQVRPSRPRSCSDSWTISEQVMSPCMRRLDPKTVWRNLRSCHEAVSTLCTDWHTVGVRRHHERASHIIIQNDDLDW